MPKITPFQQRVYDAVSQIPRGSVATYGEIAEQIGCRCAQAVGQALRKNPFAPVVPCHRVVASDGSIGGFFGQKEGPEITRKRMMLEEEGVRFDERGRVIRKHLL